MEENNVLIPEGWERVKFSEYISFQEGPGLMSFLFREVGFPFINIRCIENGNINKESCQFLSEEIAQNQYKHFQLEENDLIVSTSGTLGKKAFVKKSDLPLLLNTSIIRFKPKDTDVMSLNFLNFLLEDNSFLYNLYSQSTGSAQVNVGPTHLKKLFITIPKTSKEQNKIAEILSKVDNAISETEIIIAKYNRIKTGLIQDLLTKGIDEKGNIRSEETHDFKDSPLGRIPKEWDFLPITNVYDLKSGITPLRSNKKYFSREGHNWVKTLDLNEDYLFETEEKVSDYALNNTSLKLMPVNSILIAMYGGWEQIGRTAILKKEAGTNQAITCLSNPKFEMNSDFVQLLLQYYRFKWKQFAVSTRKDPNITKTDIENFILTFPKDITEQNKIADKINSIKENISLNEVQLNKLKSIKTGLMQDLLSGKKRITHLIN